ncbi:ABC transporter permease [Roseateles violae]|uniref:ABC transporter permease n=1 Tax=Roseateles violae TaxID=3058042 RepID=A0ABT8DQ47_9BURK|nr:ABC transporter permease [Pelomonas sp. PFR6]MDN3920471.1 ABC transporter permease [Pelomonas sp. PFR6]
MAKNMFIQIDMRRLLSHSLQGMFLGLALSGQLAHAATENKAPAPPGCGQYPVSHYGPFDYRTANQGRRDIVEDHHFTPQVESLRAGMTGPPGGDISYTLGAFPNHPRAIVSMMRLSEKLKQDPVSTAAMSVECYFLRGIRFVPDDLVFRMQYANFLISRNRTQEALKIIDQVVEKAEDNGFTHFNAGMLYFDMKEYGKALTQAHRAMELGFPSPELQKRLNSVGRWVKPAVDAASAPAQPDSAPSDASQ